MAKSEATNHRDGCKETITITGPGVKPGDAKKLLDEILNISEEELHAIFQE